MATCRECLHYEACESWTKDLFGIDNEFPFTAEPGEILCEHFKNKSDYVKRERGEWKINSDGYYPYCSRCGKEPKNGVMSDFCPYCSADMRKENNNG